MNCPFCAKPMQIKEEICHHKAGEKAYLYMHKEYFCPDHPPHAWQDSDMLQWNVDEINRVRRLARKAETATPK